MHGAAGNANQEDVTSGVESSALQVPAFSYERLVARSADARFATGGRVNVLCTLLYVRGTVFAFQKPTQVDGVVCKRQEVSLYVYICSQA